MAKLDENSRIRKINVTITKNSSDLKSFESNNYPIESSTNSMTKQRSQKKLYLTEAGNASQESMPQLVCEECDACPFCADTCSDPSCELCIEKECRHRKLQECKCQQPELISSFPFFGNNDDCPVYTPCQIRRHCTKESAWLVAGDIVYDATKFIDIHPGGRDSILRRAGGRMDCTEDVMFHSKRAQKLWKACRIGKVRPCPGSERNIDETLQDDQCIIS